MAKVVAVEGDHTGGRIVEADDQLGDGGLAASGRTNERHRLTGGDVEGDVVEHWSLGVVAEGDVHEGDRTLNGREILGVAILDDARLGLEEAAELDDG